MPPPLYISVAAVRAVGIKDPPHDDAAVTAAIRLAQGYMERACRQWFYPKACIFRLDGPDSDTIHLPVPIITLDEVRLNDATYALDPSYYRVYNTEEDRGNPRIALIDGRNADSIFIAPLTDGRMFFRRGRQNQYLAGTFGYVEADGSVPPAIQRAVLLLAVEKLTKPVYIDPAALPGPPPPSILGPIIEEGTDGHYAKYAMSGGNTQAKRASAFAGLTDNPEVLAIMKMYRAPIFISAPADPSYLR